MPSDAIPADSLVDASAAGEPAIRRMSGLPRAAVWAVLIAAPWVAIVQILRFVL